MFPSDYAMAARTALSTEQLIERTPAAFAETRDDSRTSERYTFIRTATLLDALREAGFAPTDARQARTRRALGLQHARHMIRFSHRKGNINTFIMVAHANVLRCFMMAWCNQPYETIMTQPVPANSEIFKIKGSEPIGVVFRPSTATLEVPHGPQTTLTTDKK